jgi:2-polyprenyl-3-methyl-5-hydroxy-6-metoxy-1,4-benzoquinol methylase
LPLQPADTPGAFGGNMRSQRQSAPEDRTLNNEAVTNYGWDSAVPTSCGYLAPAILKILRARGARRVLDLGCGNGELCGQLAGAGYEVVGVELDAAGVRIARQANPRIPFYNFGVHDDPQALLQQEGGRGFDAVVSTEVIEHLYAPHLLPSYARAVLVGGGQLVVSTPFHGYVKNLMLSIFDHWDRHHTPLWHGGHIKFWSRATLSRLLVEGGFDVTGFDGVGRLPYLWKSMILTARRAS